MDNIRRMFATVIVSSISILLVGCTVAPKVFSASQQRLTAGQVIERVIPAPSLAGNLLGDPTEQRVSIYLPPGYAASADKRYPVLYLLHGFTGTNRTWLIPPGVIPDDPPTDNGYGRAGFVDAERMDAFIADGVIPALIIVAPNGNNAYKHSFWVNSPVTGNWEDYVVEDVIGYIDVNYRTLKSPASRGIAGHSGGANGAMFLAMRHADIFGSVYSIAPGLGSMALPHPVALAGRSPLDPFWESVFASIAALKSVDDLPNTFSDRPRTLWLNAEFAMGAAFTPNPGRPPFFADYLYEEKAGTLVRNDAAFARRKLIAPFDLIDTHEENLKALNGIFLDFGEYEMEGLVIGNSAFAAALAERRIPFTLEIYAGGDHGNMTKERFETHGLPFFAETLAFEID